MRYGLGQNGAVAQERSPITAGTVGTKEIPYDYVATFKLQGERGKRAQDVITISTEGTFVAVTVGYSFVPSEKALVKIAATPGGSTPSIFDTTFNALFTGTSPSPPDRASDAFRSFVEGFLVKWPGIQFLYTIVDSGSGRELQNKPVHSLAGLGSADGNRPFRPFARPVAFVPRATIRIEVVELSEGPFYKDGELQIVLHGYKRLGE
jgi:hypothetical protein